MAFICYSRLERKFTVSAMVSSLVNAGKEMRSIMIPVSSSSESPRKRWPGNRRRLLKSGKWRHINTHRKQSSGVDMQMLENLVDPLLSPEEDPMMTNMVYTGQATDRPEAESKVFFQPELLDDLDEIEKMEEILQNLPGAGVINSLVNEYSSGKPLIAKVKPAIYHTGEYPVDYGDGADHGGDNGGDRPSGKKGGGGGGGAGEGDGEEEKDVLELTEEEQREKRKITCLEKSFFYAAFAAASTIVLLSLISMLLSIRWQ
ncbi:uncharacterized protein LOC113386934 [Ctenocephalides felis]|uniref:uncharacterized protein LOC113386934 n=1 Tax=Ctenocephalides felis TaxID=7515 RepID=UPI000E6E132C|nr:uncharacterized protein LOC113386934 [Ctenocephalides felis]